MIKYSNYFGMVLVLCVIVISVCSCSTSRPDPLAGWQLDFAPHTDPVIEKDYKEYIQKLNQDPDPIIFFYKDGTGQHAVLIKMGINNQVWLHILFYDKNNKRIKVIKYVSGDYYSSTSNHSCG